MFLTYKYRVLPNKRQHKALAEICESQRQLYNAALEERIDCYSKTGKGRSYFDQCKALTECRRDLQEIGDLPVNLRRWTLKRLDDAYGAFFRRCKTNGKAGFPRFRGKGWWSSFGFATFSGVKFDGKRLRFKGFSGGLRVHLCRALPKDCRITSCVFNRDHKGWNVCFQIEVAAAAKKAIASEVGIDVGLIAFAYQSDGVAIPAPQFASRADREMRRRQRAVARCKHGSNRRKKVNERVARLHRKIVDSRTTWMHQQSARIVNSYDLIAVEDLRVANMIKNRHLARSISDASWSTFTNMLSYKAEKAGGTFVKVDPKMTSQICSGCGVVVKKGLAIRVHSCPDCGLTLDRDHNAALNILHRAGNRSGAANVIHVWDERWPGNMSEAPARVLKV
jgi:putative transposase